MREWIPLERRNYLKSLRVETHLGQDLHEVLGLIRDRLSSIEGIALTKDEYYDQLCEDAIQYKMRKK